jgi:hypothetical protein
MEVLLGATALVLALKLLVFKGTTPANDGDRERISTIRELELLKGTKSTIYICISDEPVGSSSIKWVPLPPSKNTDTAVDIAISAHKDNLSIWQ